MAKDENLSRKLRTPDVVEFAVSPQVGQAVLARPTCEALAIERDGSAHFPRQAEIAGDIRSSEASHSPRQPVISEAR